MTGRMFRPGSEALLGGKGEVVLVFCTGAGGGRRSVFAGCDVDAVEPCESASLSWGTRRLRSDLDDARRRQISRP